MKLSLGDNPVMPRGGYRPGAGRPRKDEKKLVLSDEELVNMSIMEIENSNLRTRFKDMLIQFKLDGLKAGVTKREVDVIKREFEMVYEFLAKFDLLEEFEKFVRANCPTLLQL